VALDWEAIGRTVRRRTLEAVSSHFAAMAVAGTGGDADVVVSEPAFPNEDELGGGADAGCLRDSH